MLKIDKNIEFFPNEQGATLYDKRRQIEFSIGETEWKTIQFLLANDVENAEQILINETGDYISNIVDALKINGIIENQTTNYKSKFKLLFCVLNYDKLKKFKFKLERFADVVVALLPISILSALILFIINGTRLSFELNQISPKLFIIIAYISCYISLFFHELFHAIFARKYGVHIVEIGIMIKFIFPCVYLRLVGLPMCTNKQRIIVYSGGLYCHTVIFFMAFALKILFQYNNFMNSIFTILCIMNLILICINSLPIFQLDGHKIYSEILNIHSIKDLMKISLSSSHREKTIFFIASLLSIFSSILSEYFGVRWLGIVLVVSIVIVQTFILHGKILIFNNLLLLLFFIIQYMFMIFRLFCMNIQFWGFMISTCVFLAIANITTLIICFVCYSIANSKICRKG